MVRPPPYVLTPRPGNTPACLVSRLEGWPWTSSVQILRAFLLCAAVCRRTKPSYHPSVCRVPGATARALTGTQGSRIFHRGNNPVSVTRPGHVPSSGTCAPTKSVPMTTCSSPDGNSLVRTSRLSLLLSACMCLQPTYVGIKSLCECNGSFVCMCACVLPQFPFWSGF